MRVRVCLSLCACLSEDMRRTHANTEPKYYIYSFEINDLEVCRILHHDTTKMLNCDEFSGI